MHSCCQILCIPNCHFLRIVAYRLQLEIVGTKWFREGIQSLPNDTLYFINESEVEYFVGDLSWTFDSPYELKNDTVIIRTVTAALDVNDITGMAPDLIQKYLISDDSLKLVYLANRRHGGFVEADSSRY